MSEEYQYLYFFNMYKQKYQILEMDDCQEMNIDTAGEYVIKKEKNNTLLGEYKVLVIEGIIIICGGGFIYSAIKNRYWFW